MIKVEAKDCWKKIKNKDKWYVDLMDKMVFKKDKKVLMWKRRKWKEVLDGRQKKINENYWESVWYEHISENSVKA